MTLLMTLYAAGLRFQEGLAPGIQDIDLRDAEPVARREPNERRVPFTQILKLVSLDQYRADVSGFPRKRPDKTYADTSIRKAIQVARWSRASRDVYQPPRTPTAVP